MPVSKSVPARPPSKRRAEGFPVLAVRGMIEPAVRVYLPDFDQGILERLADPIQHPALDRDPLPARLWRDKHVGKVFFKNVKPWLVRHQADVRVRSGCLRCGFLQVAETISHWR